MKITTWTWTLGLWSSAKDEEEWFQGYNAVSHHGAIFGCFTFTALYSVCCLISLVLFCLSGTLCHTRSSPNTTSLPRRSGSCTCSSSPDGQPRTITYVLHVVNAQCMHIGVCVSESLGVFFSFFCPGEDEEEAESAAERKLLTPVWVLRKLDADFNLLQSSTPTVIMTHLTFHHAPNTLEHVWPVTVSSSFFCAENRKIWCICGHLYWEHSAKVMFAVVAFSISCWMLRYVACKHDDSIFWWVSVETDATVFV